MRVGRRRVRREVRAGILTALLLALAISTYLAIKAISTPIEVRRSVKVFEYEHHGRFDYTAYLKNNSLFEVRCLGTGSKIFRRITERLEISYSYEFRSSEDVDVSGDYEVVARVVTNIWSKEYTLIPRTHFNSSSFNFDLPLDLDGFEEAYDRISEEIGVEAEEPKLLIECRVRVEATTPYGPLNDAFAHSISMPLKREVFDVKGIESSRRGSINREVVLRRGWVVWRRYLWTSTSIALLSALTLFYTLTEGAGGRVNVLRRYRDWVVEAESIQCERVVAVRRPEDLVKVAEQLKRPIVKFGDALYVIDGALAYAYRLDGGSQA